MTKLPILPSKIVMKRITFHYSDLMSKVFLAQTPWEHTGSSEFSETRSIPHSRRLVSGSLVLLEGVLLEGVVRPRRIERAHGDCPGSWNLGRAGVMEPVALLKGFPMETPIRS